MQTNKAQENLEPRLQLWPSCAAMSFRLGISYASGNGQVPV